MSSDAPSQLKPAPILANDLLNMDMPALVQKVQEFRKPDTGQIDIDCPDFDQIPAEKLSELGKRLRLASSLIKRANGIYSQDPSDNGYDDSELAAGVMARLGQYEGTTAPWSLRELPPDADSQRCSTRSSLPLSSSEVNHWHSLVEAGGRPPVPLDRIHSVTTEPHLHQDLIRPWAIDPDKPGDSDDIRAKDPDNPVRDDTTPIRLELRRWREFRNWQVDNRGGRSSEDEYATFLEQRRESLLNEGASEKFAQTQMQPSRLETRWEMYQEDRIVRKEKRSSQGIRMYNKAAKRRLARHGFQKPVRFLKDPSQQSERTTWIERAAFECFSLDRAVEWTQHLQRTYDTSLKLLFDEHVLEFSELPESWWTDTARRHRQIELEKAQAAINAEVAGLDGNRRLCSAPDCKQMKEAEKKAALIERRNLAIDKFYQKTYHFRRWGRNVRRQEAMLQWVRDQLSLVEQKEEENRTESNEVHASEGKNERPRVCTKRKREDGDEVDDSRAPAAAQRKTDHQPEVTQTQPVNNTNTYIPVQGSSTSRSCKEQDAASSGRLTTSTGETVRTENPSSTGENWARRLRPRPPKKSEQQSSKRITQPSASKVTKARHNRRQRR